MGLGFYIRETDLEPLSIALVGAILDARLQPAEAQAARDFKAQLDEALRRDGTAHEIARDGRLRFEFDDDITAYSAALQKERDA